MFKRHLNLPGNTAPGRINRVPNKKGSKMGVKSYTSWWMVYPVIIPLFAVFHSCHSSQKSPTGAGFLPSTVCSQFSSLKYSGVHGPTDTIDSIPQMPLPNAKGPHMRTGSSFRQQLQKGVSTPSVEQSKSSKLGESKGKCWVIYVVITSMMVNDG